MADKKDDKKKEDQKEEQKEGKEKKEEKGKEGKEGEAAAEGEGGEGEKKPSKKKLLIIIGGAVLFLLIGGGAAAYFLVFKHKPAAEQEEGAAPKKEGEAKGEDGKGGVPQTAYYDLEEFLVNLNNGGATNQVSFLKMSVTLEMESAKDEAVIDDKLPHIRDSFQVYLRELRPSDLQGSAGIQRLREELLLRVNKIIYPAKVQDILFKEVIVQ